MRRRPQVNAKSLQRLFEETEYVVDDEDRTLVIDIRRTTSAYADEETLKATTAWIEDNFGRHKATQFGRQDSVQSHESNITIDADAENNCFEHLPHRSKLTRLNDPTMGYQTQKDRFAKGQVVFADGSRYEGEMQSRKPHGKGIFYCPTCEILYNGEWKIGVPNGYGDLVHGTRDSPTFMEYHGNFVDGKRHGEGEQRVRNGKVYIRGEFNEDVLHGKQCAIVVDDELITENPALYKCYIGSMENGIMEGEGKLTWPDNVQYKGMFGNGCRHGQGTIKDPEGKEVLTGGWVKDFPDGIVSMMRTPDGKMYSGGFKQGQRQGHGQLYLDNLDKDLIYEGLWMNGLPNGRGILISPDGKYEGEFKDGKRNGKGRFEFNEHPQQSNLKKRFYEGDWKNDRPHGTGRYLDENGGVNAYQFNNGEIVEESVQRYKSFGRAPTMRVQFGVQKAAVTDYDPKYWGIKRIVDKTKFYELHAYGTGTWDAHQNHEFSFREPTTSGGIPRGLERPTSNLMVDEVLERLDSGVQPERLEVQVIEGINLLLPGGSEDPYCKVGVGLKMKKTKAINGGESNPKWRANLKFERDQIDVVYFEAWAKRMLSDDEPVGLGEYDVREFIASPEKRKEAIIRLHKLERGREVPTGSLRVVFMCSNGYFDGESQSDFEDYDKTQFSRASEEAYAGQFESIYVNVISARDLYFVHTVNKLNFYVKYAFGDQQIETESKPGCEADCDLDLTTRFKYAKDSNLTLELWDKIESKNDELIGSAVILIHDFKEGEVEIFRLPPNREPISSGFLKVKVNIS